MMFMKGMKGMMGGGGKGQQMKPGDWWCPGCGDLQFAKNDVCRQCSTPRPAGGKSTAGMKQGDWHCPKCKDLQFAKNTECRRCGAPNPDPEKSARELAEGLAAGHGGVLEKPGDWYCPGCSDLQFARNTKCRKCGTENPDPETSLAARKEAANASGNGAIEKPGDWYCPACGDLQFARNAKCRKCGQANPDPKGSLQVAQAGGMKMNAKQEMKPGDWHCSACGDLQFARNMSCRQCGTPNFAAMFMGQQMGMMGGKGKGGKGKGGSPMIGMMNMMMGGGGGKGKGFGKKRKMCPTFQMQGFCKWGDQCYDAHF